MGLQIASLNSGSNGNCYYIGSDTEAVLIDAGISCRETEKRMKQRGLLMEKVKAVFISHEHSDHIRGITTLANKHKLPVYITPATAERGVRLIKHLSQPFIANQPITIGSLTITGFSKYHDAADPHSFVVSAHGLTVGIFTDIGTVCDNLIHYFKQCHAAFLEANYDTDMLMNGRYPMMLKNRIRGGQGHISNTEALNLFLQHRPPFMSHLFLAHLSKENNDPELAKSLFTNHAQNTHVSVASRYEASEVYYIANQ